MLKLMMIYNKIKSGLSLREFKFDILDIGFIFLIGFITYQGQTIQASCSTGLCGFGF